MSDQPPPAWLAFARWLVAPRQREEAEGDLIELWARVTEQWPSPARPEVLARGAVARDRVTPPDACDEHDSAGTSHRRTGNGDASGVGSGCAIRAAVSAAGARFQPGDHRAADPRHRPRDWRLLRRQWSLPPTVARCPRPTRSSWPVRSAANSRSRDASTTGSHSVPTSTFGRTPEQRTTSR